jgi:ELWxxDGT repeat protein
MEGASLPIRRRTRGLVVAAAIVALAAGAVQAAGPSEHRFVAGLSCFPPPDDLTVMGGAVFFTASDGSAGQELWRTEGTSATTAMLTEIRPGATGGNPCQLTATSTRLFFTADDGIHGRELWVSDGTAAGTVMVSDILPGAVGSDPNRLVRVGERVFFTALDAHGRELWVSDGTAAGTTLVADIDFEPATLNPYDCTAAPAGMPAGNRLVFIHLPAGGSPRFWVSDGTAAGTHEVPGSPEVHNLLESTGSRVLAQRVISSGVCYVLEATDGTPSGTGEIGTYCAGSATGGFEGVTALGPDFHVAYEDGVQTSIFRVRPDDSASVYASFADPAVGVFGGFTTAGSRYFFGLSPSHGAPPGDLWTSDGTSAGTQAVTAVGNLQWPAAARDLLAFMPDADDSPTWHPWTSDGTAAGTGPVPGPPVASLRRNLSTDSPEFTTARLTTVFRTAADESGACEIRAFDIPGPAASLSDADAAESAGAAVFTVTLSAPVDLPVTVGYATSDASATAGSDYVATSGTLTFAPGQTSATISVPIIDDPRDEPNEAFLLTLSAPVNAVLGRATAQGVIRDDDGRPALGNPIAVLPYTITKQGRYTLARNLSTAMSQGAAIRIDSDFVTLDLAGFKIGGQAAGPGTEAVGVLAVNRRNVTVRGGSIRGFVKGVFLQETTPGTSRAQVVDQVTVDECTQAGIHVQGSGNLVRRSRVIATGGTAADVAGILAEGDGARVLDNDVSDTRVAPGGTAAGILVRSAGVVVESNRVTGNGIETATYGIRLAVEGDAIGVRNRISRVETGIALTDGATGVTARNLTTGVASSAP